MKILHIGQLIGGLDVYIRNTIMYSSAGFEYVIVRGKKDKSQPIIKNEKSIREHNVCLGREISLSDFSCFLQLLRFVKKEKPDVIHCHSSKGGLLGRIIGSICGVRTFYTPHAFSFLSAERTFYKRICILIEKATRFKTCILACSDSEAALGREIVKYKENRIKVWSNSVPDALSKVSLSNMDIRTPCITTIGRPSSQKNTKFLLQIAKKVLDKVPDVIFYIVGVGYYSPKLALAKKYIFENNLQNNVFLIPWLSQADTYQYISKAEFYLSVSKYEGLPLAIIEALSLGKPVIASKVVGNIDCVEHERNGYLLDLNVDLFVSKIIDLLGDESKKSEFAQNSRELFEKRFDIWKKIELLEDIYKSSINNNPKTSGF